MGPTLAAACNAYAQATQAARQNVRMHTLPRTLLAATALLLATHAHAVHRCVDDKGKVTYQDSACAGPLQPTAAGHRADDNHCPQPVRD